MNSANLDSFFFDIDFFVYFWGEVSDKDDVTIWISCYT